MENNLESSRMNNWRIIDILARLCGLNIHKPAEYVNDWELIDSSEE